MRREGRVRGKPTKKSRLTGRRCRMGNYRCRDLCPDYSDNKSWTRRKLRYERFAADVCINSDLADFFLQPVLTLLRGGLEDCEVERWCSSVEADEGTMQLRTLDATVNSMIEVAFAKTHSGDREEFDTMACTTYELGGGASTDLAGDSTDIAAIESALQRQLGIFEYAVEGSSFSEFANGGWSTLSEESWSDVELSESGEENSAEDGWSLVDVNEDHVSDRLAQGSSKS